MQRSMLRVSKNAVARLIAQVGRRLLSLVLAALVARYEGAAELGRYALIVTVMGIAGAVADLGLNTLLTREAAREVVPSRQRELLGTVLSLKLMLAAAGYGLLGAVALLAPLPSSTRVLLLIGGFLLLSGAATGAMAALINARQRMEVTAEVSLAVQALTLIGAWPALAAGWGLVGVMACMAGASLLGVLFYGAILRRWGLSPLWRWEFPLWRASLAEAYPFALTGIIAMAYTRLDLLLLGLWQGDLAAGLYSAAYKLWEAVGILPSSLLDALFPELSRLAGNPGYAHRLRRLFYLFGWGLLAGSILIALIGTAGAAPFIAVVYGRGVDPAESAWVFRLLMWAVPAMFLYLLGGHTLYALDRQRQVARAMAVTSAFNIALNLAVIPRWSYRGAAAVMLASEWLLWGLLFPRAHRALPKRKS